MKRSTIAIGVASVFCILALLAAPAAAAFQNGTAGEGIGPRGGALPNGELGLGPDAFLDKLEAQGYDVSEIRAVVESGDHETARTLMQQFMEEHRDELPARPENGNRGFGPLARLNDLEQQGYDVSGIRDAIDNGDHETARALMQQFMEEHRDELPARPQNGTCGHRCITPTE
ncbi:hypothetical protein ABH15_02625 [Methanoculleus taiwanensis]|uniref:Uncharacterized protein n=1 Tax=Methanoculleus taiwanensis TaxID=1550565 RepID=A0A498H5R7_9EURY|nr:hypothetical protein [Methanoculleus taiwanensis]RXE57044.1 hypothetical protein ABH15_02625 [Methanoculleus taiwanensis]